MWRAFSFSIFHLMFEIFVTFRSKHSNNSDACLLFLLMCDLVDFTDVCLCGSSDINECEEVNGGCQQTCVNTPGSYHCECSEGFRTHTDGRTCIGTFWTKAPVTLQWPLFQLPLTVFCTSQYWWVFAYFLGDREIMQVSNAIQYKSLWEVWETLTKHMQTQKHKTFFLF